MLFKIYICRHLWFFGQQKTAPRLCKTAESTAQNSYSRVKYPFFKILRKGGDINILEYVVLPDRPFVEFGQLGKNNVRFSTNVCEWETSKLRDIHLRNFLTKYTFYIKDIKDKIVDIFFSKEILEEKMENDLSFKIKLKCT